MASVEKFSEAAVVNELRHNVRSIQQPSNTDIDKSRSKQNYCLSPDRGMTAYDYYKARKNKLYCYGRDDVKVLAGWIITAPKELEAKQQELFFQSTYDFLVERYGEENLIQAIVHQDESGQPHLHYLFIPAVPDEKHGGEKICANDVLNRRELRNFHPDLQRYLDAHGIDAKIMSGVTQTQGGNRTVLEMKAERSIKRKFDRGRW